ncbi:MAG: hypothetical protein WBG50_13595 [Desulfomonilaceae bacterium]
MHIEQATVFFLVIVFAAAEVYRMLRGRRGVLVSEDNQGLPGIALPVTSVKVRLESGDEVTATMNCCTACLGRLKIGDEVRVSDSSDGYVVDLPWFRRGSCHSRTSMNV